MYLGDTIVVHVLSYSKYCIIQSEIYFSRDNNWFLGLFVFL